MNLELLTRTDSALCIYIKKRSLNDAPSVKVRKLRLLSSECYRPLVLEMKEWPDAFTMFSQGPHPLETRPFNRERKITFSERCEVHFRENSVIKIELTFV